MGKQLSDAFRGAHGQLHKELDVKPSKKIPEKKLESAVKKGGLEGKRAQPVLNMERARRADGGRLSAVDQERKHRERGGKC